MSIAPDRLTGLDGLREAIGVLDGFELPAAAWERAVLPGRVERLRPVDARHAVPRRRGRVGAAVAARRRASRTEPLRLTPATPIALFLREHAGAWQPLREPVDERDSSDESG